MPARAISKDVGHQGIHGADHGLVGEPGGPQNIVDGLAQAQAVGAQARLLEGVGDHGGMGEQVGADLLAERGQLLGPVAGGVALDGQAGVDLVDEPVDQIGLAVGAWVVGYGTSLGELAVMGFITGIPLGAVQAYLLRNRLANAWVWAAAVPLLWALGWTVTTAGGIDVDRQFAVFGAYGAITFMALSRC